MRWSLYPQPLLWASSARSSPREQSRAPTASQRSRASVWVTYPEHRVPSKLLTEGPTSERAQTSEVPKGCTGCSSSSRPKPAAPGASSQPSSTQVLAEQVVTLKVGCGVGAGVGRLEGAGEGAAVGDGEHASKTSAQQREVTARAPPWSSRSVSPCTQTRVPDPSPSRAA